MMAKMWKNIPIIVLIVVLLAVMGINDVSCGSSANKNEGEVQTDVLNAELESGFANMLGRVKHTAENIVPDRVTDICSRLTKKQIIAISLVGTAVVILSSFAAHRANNSPKKYDIVNEAKQVNSALGSSSGSTYEELDRITTALCTKLSDSPDDPPLNTSTLAATTENLTTKTFTTEADTTEIDTTALAKITEIKATEGMPTMPPPPVDPEVVCPTAADKIFRYMKGIIGKLKEGFVVFDLVDEHERDDMRSELQKTANADCEPHFFQHGYRGDREGVSFSISNKYIAGARNDDACRMGVDKIMPVLYELGYDSSGIGIERPTLLNFGSSSRRDTFLEGEALFDNNNCGAGFFEISADGDDKYIKYLNSNTFISAGWSKTINNKNCQERANKMISILSYGGHSSIKRIVQVTATNNTYDTEALRAAYTLHENLSCGVGALNMEVNGDDLSITYHNTNPFVREAWKAAPKTVVCKRMGMDILQYLVELGIYSTDDNASIIVPTCENNVEILRQKILSAERYNCQEGFFRLTSEDGYYKVHYEKNCPYIKPEWDKITSDQFCGIAATGVYNMLKARKKTISPGSNYLALTGKQSVRDELERKFNITTDSSCGEGFFVPLFESNYIGVKFNTSNPYIKSEWVNFRT